MAMIKRSVNKQILEKISLNDKDTIIQKSEEENKEEENLENGDITPISENRDK